MTKVVADVVGHGLRAQFAENMARVKGFCPATLGGKANQMPWDELQSKLAEVSELLGHSRTQILGAYFGAFRRPRSDDPDRRLTYVGSIAATSEEGVIAAARWATPACGTGEVARHEVVSNSAVVHVTGEET
ncbi:hypothetical protein [Paraburkholderia ferrariae]|uniref:Uncharacterized protein n=1 Tax=Paraburkholderia ferrariae TaxID=386056 RepID=A0ABU9S4H1_9BURK